MLKKLEKHNQFSTFKNKILFLYFFTKIFSIDKLKKHLLKILGKLLKKYMRNLIYKKLFNLK